MTSTATADVGLMPRPWSLAESPLFRIGATASTTDSKVKPPVFQEWNLQNHQLLSSVYITPSKSPISWPHNLPATNSTQQYSSVHPRKRKEERERKMASVKRASVVVAASVAAVEALKDQAGLCRWNYPLRSLQQHAKSHVGSLSQAARMSSAIADTRSGECVKQSEESLRKVMYLSCWGPN